MTESKVDSFDGRVRPATVEDRGFVVSLIPRLVEFGQPPWYDAAAMTRVDAEIVERNLLGAAPGTVILIAEDTSGRPVGFIHLVTRVDYYTGEEHGHVSDLIVAREGEGRGVGAALMAAGEAWAEGQGFRLLTLHVFARNVRARKVYERLGYTEKFIRCTKPLNRAG